MYQAIVLERSTRSHKDNTVHQDMRFITSSLNLPPFVEGGERRPAQRTVRCWYSIQGQEHDRSSHVWQQVIDPEAILFLHQEKRTAPLIDQILSPLHIFWPGAEHSQGVEEMFAICQLIHCITLFIHKSVLYELSLCESTAAAWNWALEECLL